MRDCIRKLFTGVVLCVALSPAAHAQTYTDLLNFDGTHGSDPDYPQLLAQGRDGNLYGTAPIAKKADGVVFRLTPKGVPAVLHSFSGGDGDRPYSGLTLGTDGNFYGTTSLGGSSGFGTVFRVTPNGTLTTLHNFTSVEGQTEAPPVEAAEGGFYGLAATPSTATVYAITGSQGFNPLASFTQYGGGSNPLLQATDGSFYGTGAEGDTDHGAAFTMTRYGFVTIFFDFDAHVPAQNAFLIQATDGNFYGTTYVGGDHNQGVIFRLTPKGAATILHNFPDTNYPHDGSQPSAGLVQASDGNLYGVAKAGGTMGYGVIFEITLAGDYSILYNFDDATGGNPTSTPMQHTNGVIYGLTAGGGTNGLGVAYSFNLGLPSFVRLLPTLGEIGATVEVLGQGFTGATGVSFNGVAAAFNVESDTYLTAIVPAGASTGLVAVTTLGGTLTSNQPFTLFQ
jgi:uncharacterized repeat protein (TIGR03803 family)